MATEKQRKRYENVSEIEREGVGTRNLAKLSNNSRYDDQLDSGTLVVTDNGARNNAPANKKAIDARLR